jgi:hypothetical protein
VNAIARCEQDDRFHGQREQEGPNHQSTSAGASLIKLIHVLSTFRPHNQPFVLQRHRELLLRLADDRRSGTRGKKSKSNLINYLFLSRRKYTRGKNLSELVEGRTGEMDDAGEMIRAQQAVRAEKSSSRGPSPLATTDLGFR